MAKDDGSSHRAPAVPPPRGKEQAGSSHLYSSLLYLPLYVLYTCILLPRPSLPPVPEPHHFWFHIYLFGYAMGTAYPRWACCPGGGTRGAVLLPSAVLRSRAAPTWMQARTPWRDTRGVEGGVNVSDPRSILAGASIPSAGGYETPQLVDVNVSDPRSRLAGSSIPMLLLRPKHM